MNLKFGVEVDLDSQKIDLTSILSSASALNSTSTLEAKHFK